MRDFTAVVERDPATGLFVGHWATDDFDARRQELEQLGASLYRGPMKIEDELWMAQLRDPFGNLIGIRGPRRKAR